ncbi:hypothetical protein O181_120272 [Austropuccinia psidii MF-1]|uniref:Retroviral polymerase SH3-like domain-containing protein n=1 Tax=Austropuccinia psidii MF-1 TaxID=1389203 RepID=A0A9Q3KGQ9_9BASI|nr:hypothetical protein [Austropuccinia psidii MF-1]
MLRIFGVMSFIHDHTFKKDFSGREITGYHLGISEDSKGWLFWVPGKRTIVRLASVKFDENTFYKPRDTHVQSIQVTDLFDEYMVKEINNQDKLITTISKETDPEVVLPNSYHEAIKSANRNQWIKAMKDRLNSMIEENLFKRVGLKQALAKVPHESILSTKWLFVKKPERYKPGLVARGFRKIHGINYEETFAPTPTFNALRLLFSTACLKNGQSKPLTSKLPFYIA